MVDKVVKIYGSQKLIFVLTRDRYWSVLSQVIYSQHSVIVFLLRSVLVLFSHLRRVSQMPCLHQFPFMSIYT
jgi:hypothetical protein